MSQKLSYAQVTAKPAIPPLPQSTCLTKKDAREKERRDLYTIGMERLHSYMDAQTPEEIARKVADKRSVLMAKLEKELAAYEKTIIADNTVIQNFINTNKTYTGQCFHPTKEVYDDNLFETDCIYLYCKYCKNVVICEQIIGDYELNVPDRNRWVTPYHIIHGDPNPSGALFSANTKLR
jgi:hypothetical protein